MREETFATIRKMAETHLKIDESRIGEDSNLADLGLDSLGALQLVFDLEERFNVIVSDEQARAFRTIREVCDGIETLQEQRP